VIFGVLTVVTMNNTLVWVVTPRGMVDVYERFGRKYYYHLQGRCSLNLNMEL
jgi:hypothetical protein